MAARKVEQELDRLSALREAPEAEAVAALAKALGDRINVIAAKAAKIAASRQLTALVPNLLRAYHRFFENDPQCWAKNAIAQALVELEYREAAPFVRGARHVQMEPVWGGQVDTATTLRSICALALPACFDIARPEVLRLLVDLLADKADPVRVDAVRALGQMGGDESILLLRLKARVGDATPQVVGQTFDTLLGMEGEDAVSFIASFLESSAEAVRVEAALSMGSARLPAAVEALLAAWEATRDPDLKSSILRGLAVSRLERALGFLMELIREGRARDACAAIDALAVDRDSADIYQRVVEAASEREPEVRQAVEKAFAGSSTT